MWLAQAKWRMPAVRAAHWTTAVMLVALPLPLPSEPGTQAAIGGLFALSGTALVGLMLLAGPVSRPGPRLSRVARAAFFAVHRGLPALVVAVIATGLPVGMAGAGVAEALGGGGPALALWHERLYAATLAAAAAHVLFNMWRTAACGERVFSKMLGG